MARLNSGPLPEYFTQAAILSVLARRSREDFEKTDCDFHADTFGAQLLNANEKPIFHQTCVDIIGEPSEVCQ